MLQASCCLLSYLRPHARLVHPFNQHYLCLNQLQLITFYGPLKATLWLPQQLLSIRLSLEQSAAQQYAKRMPTNILWVCATSAQKALISTDIATWGMPPYAPAKGRCIAGTAHLPALSNLELCDKVQKLDDKWMETFRVPANMDLTRLWPCLWR